MKIHRKPDLTLLVCSDVDATGEVWILDSGSSRHLVNDEAWLGDVELCKASCVQPNGDRLQFTKKGTLTLRVSACGAEKTIKLTDVYFGKNLKHNLISYSMLDNKGYMLLESNRRCVMAAKDGSSTAFDVGMQKNVLMVRASVVNQDKSPSDGIMTVLESEANGSHETPSDVQKATLVEYHTKLGNLNYDAGERLARDPSSGIMLTDHKRMNCLTCAEGKKVQKPPIQQGQRELLTHR
ncbi:hypothetical protein PR002_g1254 [Phytophthora rubi]|uniref:Retrovirus-related Pol polyprotein from transposon TNT 1-94-like beta-barrel domain-containing protein n=1 Tax=Phytophthora rubi TaxID=129364 RepID=A0A6A3P0A9_9STRA|nr:hypothetical protein PR002_g1254 [Phytophthora rubi]